MNLASLWKSCRNNSFKTYWTYPLMSSAVSDWTVNMRRDVLRVQPTNDILTAYILQTEMYCSPSWMWQWEKVLNYVWSTYDPIKLPCVCSIVFFYCPICPLEFISASGLGFVTLHLDLERFNTYQTLGDSTIHFFFFFFKSHAHQGCIRYCEILQFKISYVLV